MVTSMIPNVNNVFKNPNIIDMRFLSPYNPLINYDWSTTTTSGLRYLKDVGSTPTYNASMYFGRGAYLNGVDQSITVPINTTIQTALKRVNGVVTINEASQTLTNYVIGGLGVHKDYYLFTRLLTTAEKDSYTNTPELFYAMAQADSTCVLNIPMCETDGYVRNMKSYSLGTNLDSIKLSGIITGAGNTIVQDVNVFNISSVTAAKAAYHPLIAFSPTTFTSDLYNIEVEVKCISGTLKVARLECTSPLALNDILTERTAITYRLVRGFEDIGGRRGAIVLDGLNYPIFTAVVTVKKVEKITAGMYPIINYTSSVRDNAKNLQYGLQTCKFVRNSLGIIQSASNYLECDGTGYANTGWIPPSDSDWAIETTFDNVLSAEYIGRDGGGSSYLVLIGSYGDGQVYARIGTSTHKRFPVSLGEHKLFIRYKASGTYDVYIDGIVAELNIPHSYDSTTSNRTFFVGAKNSGTATNIMTKPIKTFKVHTDITKALEHYLAQL